MPTFADYDRDGDLDCYILTHQLYREKGRPIEPIRIMEKNGKFVVDEPYQPYYEVDDERDEQGGFLYSEVGRPDYFLRNDGAKGFTDVTTASGIGSSNEWGNSCTWWDYNNDGWPDLYVGNDFASPDRLYRNNGDGTFSEIARGTIRHSTWFTMGRPNRTSTTTASRISSSRTCCQPPTTCRKRPWEPWAPGSSGSPRSAAPCS
ncbi:MAG: VCBS repeat-containing protein [Verrucomicrobiales bacterium]